MVRSAALNFIGNRAARLAAIAGFLVAAPAAWADPPTPFVMTTEISFPAGNGVFYVQEPSWICPTGVFENLRELATPPTSRGAFTVTAVVKYTCADGSGTFITQPHPQGNYGNYGNGFAVSGPWSFLPGGTGDYTNLRGHGEMGFNFITFDPVTGTETFVGLVQSN